MAKQGHQQTPAPVDPTDTPTRQFVERLGGRGAPDYIMASMSGNQAYVDGGTTAVDFDTADESRGLTVDGSGRFSGLKAGRTYLLQASLKATNSATFENQVRWYNVTGAALFGPIAYIRSTSASSHNSTQPIASYMFTPSVDTQVELRMLGGGTASTTFETAGSWACVTEIGGPGGLSGPIEHLETIEVGAATQTVTFNGLDGDTDGEYILVTHIYNQRTPTSSAYIIRPNGLSTNQSGQKTTATGTTVATQNFSTEWMIAQFTAPDLFGQTTIEARTGVQRRSHTEASSGDPGASQTSHWYSGQWDETATNITSMDVHCTAGAFIDAGSTFTLYRRKRTNAAGPAYAVCRLSANQSTNVAVDNHVEFDTIASRGGRFSLATGAGQADGLLTVQPGTYEIDFDARFTLSTTSEVFLELRDNSDDSAITDVAGGNFRPHFPAVTNGGNASPAPHMRSIFEFTAPTTIKMDIRSISAGTVSLITVDQTKLLIKEI